MTTITTAMAPRVFGQALAAATAAKLKFFQDGRREAPFNCGFAWVTIPGNSGFARWCRKQTGHQYGSKGYPKGWQFWGPGSWPTAEQAGVETVYGQDMDVNIEGARAFAEVLKGYGVDATVGYRYD